MWTSEILEHLAGKTIVSATPSYAGGEIYEITVSFTDSTTIVIDTEHKPDHPLQVAYKK